MRRLVLVISLLLASPTLGREVVEISKADGEVAGVVLFCTLSTRPDDSIGYAIVALGKGSSSEQPAIIRAVGMSPGDEAGSFGELNASTVGHVCGAGGASVLAVAVNLEGRKAVALLMPKEKELRKESAYSAAHQAMQLANRVLDAMALKKGFSYARARQGAERSIVFYQDLLVLNRPRTNLQESEP